MCTTNESGIIPASEIHTEIMKEKIRIMLKMQDAMNSKVNADWRSAGNAWYRAIWTECAEMLDHYGWKWWKHQQPDIKQVQLEVVDIWHFIMSDLLNREDNKETIIQQIIEQMAQVKPSEDIHAAIEKLALTTLQTRSASIPEFAGLLQHADMTFDDMFRMYVGKNVLNIFRQDHGYKMGTYIKIWNNREDNEHLADILVTLDPSKPTFQEDIYKNLEVLYPTS